MCVCERERELARQTERKPACITRSEVNRSLLLMDGSVVFTQANKRITE